VCMLVIDRMNQTLVTQSLTMAFIVLQWGPEFRTSPEFKWSILPRTGHLYPDHLKPDIFVWFSNGPKLDHFIQKKILFMTLFYL
jgi:hypothetical protein